MASNTPRQCELESRLVDDRAGPLGPHAARFAIAAYITAFAAWGSQMLMFLVSGMRNKDEAPGPVIERRIAGGGAYRDDHDERQRIPSVGEVCSQPV